MKKYFYFAFQTLFIAITFFILHYSFFDFSSAENPQSYWENWASVIYFDAFVGLVVGLLISLFSVVLNKNEKSLIIALIFTDFAWLAFCFYWYFNNRGVINVEAVGHLISPVIVGAFGVFLAFLNLFYSLWQNKKAEAKLLND